MTYRAKCYGRRSMAMELEAKRYSAWTTPAEPMSTLYGINRSTDETRLSGMRVAHSTLLELVHKYADELCEASQMLTPTEDRWWEGDAISMSTAPNSAHAKGPRSPSRAKPKKRPTSRD
jgi:hypothetical protein